MVYGSLHKGVGSVMLSVLYLDLPKAAMADECDMSSRPGTFLMYLFSDIWKVGKAGDQAGRAMLRTACGVWLYFA